MRNGGITLTGVVLDIDHKSGTKNGKDWAFDIVSVLTGKSVSEVRWPQSDDLGSLPKVDERITLVVELDVFNGRQQIEAVSRLRDAALAPAGGARVSA